MCSLSCLISQASSYYCLIEFPWMPGVPSYPLPDTHKFKKKERKKKKETRKGGAPVMTQL